jgi:hypothetical protein
MDHGYQVDEDRRCTARTQKQRQCSLPPIRGIELCALHAGLARAKGSSGYGDPKALDAYKRSVAAREARPHRDRAR